MTSLAPDVVATVPETGDSLTHSVCWCNDDVALCGANVTGQPWADEEEDVDCVVCQDLMFLPCPRCGG